MRVGEVMASKVETCSATDPLDVPARTMRDQSCDCVVVVDEKKRPVAMLTDRDICMCALMTLTSLPMLRVCQAMSRNVAMCRADTTLSEAEGIMRGWHVRRLPVTDGAGALVGLLSLDDIVWAAARTHGLLEPAAGTRARADPGDGPRPPAPSEARARPR